MKVNHEICKFCIYSEYKEKGYRCSKKENILCEVLEQYEFDCPYHKEF